MQLQRALERVIESWGWAHKQKMEADAEAKARPGVMHYPYGVRIDELTDGIGGTGNDGLDEVVLERAREICGKVCYVIFLLASDLGTRNLQRGLSSCRS